MCRPGVRRSRQTINDSELASRCESRTLRFWHRVLTYDVMYSAGVGACVDTLNVKLTDEQGQQIALLLRAGNPTSNWGALVRHWLAASGRRSERVRGPYSASSPSRTATARRPPKDPDNMLNTWSYVDGIQIYDRNPMYLPVITRTAPAAMPASGASESALHEPAADVPAARSPDMVAGEETTVRETPIEAEPVR